MSRFLAAISLSLGLLLGLAGCVGVESESSTLPGADVTKPAQAAGPEPREVCDEPPEDNAPEPAALDNTDIRVESGETAVDPVTISDPETAPPTRPKIENATVSEPNAPVPAEPAGSATVEATPFKAIVPAEPNVLEADGTEFQGVEPPIWPTPQEPTTNEVVADSEHPDDEEPGALASFYQGYGEILQDYVLEDGRVDYGRLRRKRLRVKHLLNEPDELDPDVYRGWTDREKLAFWINTYNLKMLDVILRNYPIESSWWLRLTWPPSDIRHIDGIWSNYRFIVMDEEFTLAAVERRFFGKAFGDPRAYLALTYAARSGPTLRRAPYQGAPLDEQLDEQVKAFLSSDQGFRIDRDKAVVYLSALFKPGWRGKDFVARYGTHKKFKSHPPETRAVLNFLTQYISQDDVYFLEVENYTLAYMNFDWRLNDSGRGY